MKATSYKQALRVIEGAQKGRQKPLHTASIQTIGNSFECDIYLNEPGEADFCLEVLPGTVSTSIMLRNGEAILDSKPMNPGERYKLGAGVPVRLGSTLFVVEPLHETVGNGVLAPEHADTLPVGAPEVVPGVSLIQLLHRPAFLITLIVCGLVGSTIVALRAEPSRVVTDMPDDLQNKDTVAVSNKSANLYDVRNMPTQVVTDTGAASDLENSIREIFRTHGLKASLTTLAQGRIVLRTSTADIELLERAEAAANADVYGLQELNVINSKPPEIEPGSDKKTQPVLPAVDPGQAIRLVMVGNPSYVVTDDESRYFPGSQLPTGHRIKAILKNKVILQKNGVTTELFL